VNSLSLALPTTINAIIKNNGTKPTNRYKKVMTADCGISGLSFSLKPPKR